MKYGLFVLEARVKDLIETRLHARRFVLTLATRDARECRREGRCDPVLG